jgi:hypothetical protein
VDRDVVGVGRERWLFPTPGKENRQETKQIRGVATAAGHAGEQGTLA